MDTLQTRFLPEFLNRIDEILIFHPLKREQIHKIVELQIERLEEQLHGQGIELEVTARRAGRNRRRGLRPDLRRPAPEARDPAADPESAGRGASQA